MDMPEIDKVIKQSVRYRYEDGLGEAFWGVGFVLIGLIFFVAPATWPYSKVAFLATVFVVSWLFRRIVRALKKRFVYPRTGMATSRKAKLGSRAWAAGIIAGLVAMVVAAVITLLNRRSGLDWLLFANGLILGAFMLFIALKVGLRRYFFLAAFTALAGPAAAFAGLGPEHGTAAFYTALGLALLTSGAITFLIYLRQAPRPQEQ